MQNDRQYLVLGYGNPGRFVHNVLQETGAPVYAIGRSREAGRRRGSGSVLASDSLAELRAGLDQLSPRERRTVVFLASGYFLTMLLEGGEFVYEECEVRGPDLATARILNQKESTHRYLDERGYRTIRSYRPQEVANIPEGEFPVIVKWNQTVTSSATRGRKTEMYRTRQELERASIAPERIVQPYLGNRQQVSYGAYYHQNEPIFDIVVEQVTMFPAGASTLVRSIEGTALGERIRADAASLLAHFDYTGFVEVEFLIDLDNDVTYVLEVNPRAWGWISILSLKYHAIGRMLADPAWREPGAANGGNGVWHWVNVPRFAGGFLLEGIVSGEGWGSIRAVSQALLKPCKWELLP